MTTARTTVTVDADPLAFSAEMLARGWSDGLPVIPPTERLVDTFIAASGLPGSFEIGVLYPAGAVCTVELLAVNAVMAGAPASSMPLLCAAVSAIADPHYDLAGVNTTTAAVVPTFVVNGPVRNEVGVPYQYSAWGGAAGVGPAIGRALRLVVRNVAGQVEGQTSESVFGNPGRIAGIIAGEWEEESPWAPLAERRGVPGNAVTAFCALGSANVIEPLGFTGAGILEVIAKSLAYIGNNMMTKNTAFAHQLVAVNPIWAPKIYKDFPKMEDVQDFIYRHARAPIEMYPQSLRGALEDAGKVRSGVIHLMDGPEDVSLIVNGGKGNLHAMMFPGFSNMLPVTRSLDPSQWKAHSPQH